MACARHPAQSVPCPVCDLLGPLQPRTTQQDIDQHPAGNGSTNSLRARLQPIPHDIPALPPLAISPLIGPGKVVMLVGLPGIGKSTALAEMAYMVARSIEDKGNYTFWGGLLQVNPQNFKGSKVLLLEDETTPEGWARYMRHHIEAGNGFWQSEGVAKALKRIVRLPAESIGLTDPETRHDAALRVARLCKEEEIGLCIIDPISQVFGMREAGSPDWVNDALMPLKNALSQQGCITVLSAHTSRMGDGLKPLGSSQQEGAADILFSAREILEMELNEKDKWVPVEPLNQLGIKLILTKFRADGRFWIRKYSTADLTFGKRGGGYSLTKDPHWTADEPEYTT